MIVLYFTHPLNTIARKRVLALALYLGLELVRVCVCVGVHTHVPWVEDAYAHERVVCVQRKEVVT